MLNVQRSKKRILGSMNWFLKGHSDLIFDADSRSVIRCKNIAYGQNNDAATVLSRVISFSRLVTGQPTSSHALGAVLYFVFKSISI